MQVESSKGGTSRRPGYVEAKEELTILERLSQGIWAAISGFGKRPNFSGEIDFYCSGLRRTFGWHSPRIRLKPSPHESVRHRLHQFPDFRFKKAVRNDQRADGSAQVAVACGNCLVDGGVQLGSVVFAQ
jgi:hypothetical protein